MPKPPPNPHPSPYVYTAVDGAGLVLRITVDYNNNTRSIQGATILREVRTDPEGQVLAVCVYSRILLGIGANGDPRSSTRSFTVPTGTTVITKQQLTNLGFSNIEDVWALQITASP
jgi:hypothetical protein